MTEDELIDADFERIDVLVEESGDKYDYHYYRKMICENFVLTTNANDEAANKNWIVYVDETDRIIKDIDDVNLLCALFQKFYKNKHQ